MEGHLRFGRILPEHRQEVKMPVHFDGFKWIMVLMVLMVLRFQLKRL